MLRMSLHYHGIWPKRVHRFLGTAALHCTAKTKKVLRREQWKLLRAVDSSIELSEPMRVELLLELSGLPRQEAMVIKSCTKDSRNFESVRATLVEYHTGVHLSEGRTS
ncbi:unnamed protein product, partial [Symbiodinium necroappetens]